MEDKLEKLDNNFNDFIKILDENSNITKDELIESLLKIKDYNKEFLLKHDIKFLLNLYNNPNNQKLLQDRLNYENELFNLDNDRFNLDIIKNYNFNKIHNLYSEHILHKDLRIKFINKIINLSHNNISENRLNKWSTERIIDKAFELEERNEKDKLITNLKLYGDGISNFNTPINIMQQRLKFLNKNGSTLDSIKRLKLSKQIALLYKKHDKKHNYKKLMITDLNLLNQEYIKLKHDFYRNDLIDFLKNHDYELEFLNKQKLYVLEYLKADLLPCKKGSRSELIKILSNKNIWSRSTLMSWNTKKLKDTYSKLVQYNYGPLNKDIIVNHKNKFETNPRTQTTREQCLKDISDTLFFDLINKNN